MANKKISALDALGGTPAVSDILPVTDVSDTTGSAQGTTKKVTVANLMAAAPVQTSDLGTAAGLNVGTADTNVVQLSNVSGTIKLPAVDGSQLLNLPSGDISGPLDTALRGTTNPHIGAYPNQSFKTIDNPSSSVMVVADEAGNLEFVTKDGANVYVNTPSARLALAKGFSVQEDGDEPDIEVVTPSGVTYSVISGDSDTKGANGLPTRQGFNLPDIGANPAPILISGGSIA
jgi:hypothetical protein